MLSGTLKACLLGNLLTGKGPIATSQRWGKIRASENFNGAPSCRQFWNTKIWKWT